MNYVTADDLNAPSEAIWHRVEAGEEFVVTREGKAIALLVRTDAEALENQLRALRLQRFGQVVRCIQAHAAATGADLLTDDDIQAEIDAVRVERRGAARGT